MGEPYYIYKGVDSREIGVIVQKMPDLHRAPENVTLLQVKGIVKQHPGKRISLT